VTKKLGSQKDNWNVCTLLAIKGTHVVCLETKDSSREMNKLATYVCKIIEILVEV
jgi:hypothetical protein